MSIKYRRNQLDKPLAVKTDDFSYQDPKLTWIKSAIPQSAHNQLSFFIPEKLDRPDVLIDYDKFPDNIKALAIAVRNSRAKSQTYKAGARVTPSEIEFLFRDIMHGFADGFYFPSSEAALDLESPLSSTEAELKGELNHLLAETVVRACVEGGDISAGKPKFEYFISGKKTHIANFATPDINNLQSFFPALGDGLKSKAALRHYEKLDIHSESEISTRIAVLHSFARAIEQFRMEEYDQEMWFKIRDSFFFQLDYWLVKIEILIMFIQHLQAFYTHVDIREQENNITVNAAMAGPFIYNWLNPHPDVPNMIEQTPLINQDVLVVRMPVIGTNNTINITLQEGQNIRSGTIRSVEEETIVSLELLPAMLLINHRGQVFTPKTQQLPPFIAILVSPNIQKYVQDAKQILMSAQGAQINKSPESGKVFWADKSNYYFNDFHLTHLGIQIVARPDLVLKLANQNQPDEYHIYDFKSRVKFYGDIAQELSVALYILNVAVSVYYKPNSGDQDLIISGVDLSDPLTRERLSEIVNRIKFFYFDIATGNKVPFVINPERLFELLHLIKFSVETKIVYSSLLKPLLRRN
jgi:hypothetical protein